MIFDKLLIFTAVTASMAAALNIVGASLYDIRQVKRQQQAARHPFARQYRQRPLVSVIVTTANHEKTIVACLESLMRSSYRKAEIIVADNGSTDSTARLVRQFIKNHPAKKLKLHVERLRSESSQGVYAAFNQYAHGDLILVLDGSQEVDRQALSRAVHYLNSEPATDVLGAHYKVRKNLSYSSLFNEFGLLVRNRSSKVASALGGTYSVNLYGVSFYRRDAFGPSADTSLRAGYASEVFVYGPNTSFYGLAKQVYGLQLRRLGWLAQAAQKVLSSDVRAWRSLPLIQQLFAAISLINGLALPLMLTYFGYLAIRLHQPALLIASWLALSLFLVLSIWDDDQSPMRQKLKYVGLMPVTYGWFYLMSFVQYLAAVGVLRKTVRQAGRP